MQTAAIIVAAGRGSRMGPGPPKIGLKIAGEAILALVVRAFVSHPRIGSVVVVADPARAASILGPELTAAVDRVEGGAVRQDSVRAGLARIGDAGIVLIHEAARPLVSAGLIERVLEETIRSGAAVPAIPVTDTVKRIEAGSVVGGTVPRGNLVLAQTPQGFRSDRLRAAFARADQDGYAGTDDASLLEHAGERVTIVPGDAENIKITHPADLRLAEAIARARSGERVRG